MCCCWDSYGRTRDDLICAEWQYWPLEGRAHFVATPLLVNVGYTTGEDSVIFAGDPLKTCYVFKHFCTIFPFSLIAFSATSYHVLFRNKFLYHRLLLRPGLQLEMCMRNGWLYRWSGCGAPNCWRPLRILGGRGFGENVLTGFRGGVPDAWRICIFLQK